MVHLEEYEVAACFFLNLVILWKVIRVEDDLSASGSIDMRILRQVLVNV